MGPLNSAQPQRRDDGPLQHCGRDERPSQDGGSFRLEYLASSNTVRARMSAPRRLRGGALPIRKQPLGAIHREELALASRRRHSQREVRASCSIAPLVPF